ncbi:hypothetical protein FLLO111716_09420 [Flavobacterium longum]|uniref:DUF7619 domain-containing protein n=1 Tax=Flavobacterium longum TaxID=1299340 RepID=UPI0039E8A312
MKKITLLLLFFAGMVNAQILTFTDPALKSNLLLSDVNNAVALNFADQQMKIDVNSNGEIDQFEANLVKKLFITDNAITSVGGLEDFANLQILWIWNPAITNLSLTMPTIKELDVRNTGALVSIDGTGMTALEKVYCTLNNASLAALDFSGCTALNDVYAPSNPLLATVNLTGCSALATVDVNSCALTQLTLAGCSALSSLHCNGNQITALDLTDAVALQTLNALSVTTSSIILNAPNTLQTAWFYTDQPSLDLSNYTVLVDLDLRGNLPINVNLQGCTALDSPDFQSNVVNLDLSGCTSLVTLGMAGPILESVNLENTPQLLSVSFSSATPNTTMSGLDVSNHPNLLYLIVDNFALDSLLMDNCPALTELRLWKTTLPTIDLNGHPALGQLIVTENPVMTELDLSTLELPNAFLWIADNPVLTYINLKNGIAENFNLVSNFGHEIFICQDEQYVAQTLANILPEDTPDPVNCNSYCSFVPGGDYNTITGRILFDGNNNGCDSGDTPRPDIKLSINDGTETGSTFSSNTGNYHFYTGAGSFDVWADFENAAFFNLSPATAAVSFADDNNNVATQDFCLTANGIHPDVEIAVAPIVPARPGFVAVYQIVLKNKGNQTLSGNFNLTFDDDVLEFSSATPATSSQATGSLNWNYVNLAPFENRSVYVSLNVNTPTQTPAVNAGDILTFTATANPIAGDEHPGDNQLVLQQTVVNSFDPNDITCLEGEVVSPAQIGNYLHYILNFENLGSAEAANVVARIDIDESQFDISSLQVLNTSAESYIRVSNSTVEFIFQDINLAPAAGDPPVGGHGNVLFKIKSNGQLTTGDVVGKKSDIYFDYNFPVATNMALTTFQLLGNPAVPVDPSISVYPNPAQDQVNISCGNAVHSVEIFDIQGRILQISSPNSSQAVIDLSNRASGTYFFRIRSEAGTIVTKVIKD